MKLCFAIFRTWATFLKPNVEKISQLMKNYDRGSTLGCLSFGFERFGSILGMSVGSSWHPCAGFGEVCRLLGTPVCAIMKKYRGNRLFVTPTGAILATKFASKFMKKTSAIFQKSSTNRQQIVEMPNCREKIVELDLAGLASQVGRASQAEHGRKFQKTA